MEVTIPTTTATMINGEAIDTTTTMTEEIEIGQRQFTEGEILQAGPTIVTYTPSCKCVEIF
jgi:hypothetical protein